MRLECRPVSLRAGRWAAAVLLAAGIATPAWSQAKTKGKPAAAAAALPTVSVAGVRVVTPGLGEQGTEIRAFNESAGTAIALFVKMPAGAGIVEVDSDKCTLTALTDDTGANLLEEARFSPFPKVTKDGSAAEVEMEARARPSAEAKMLAAEGAIGLKSASGTKVQKVANLPVQAGKTFKVGTAVVTLGEVSAEGEQASVTLKLPRSVLLTIKEIRWKDAKGATVEARRTGSGWMNEDAEVSYQVPASLKTANLELDVWQNLKEQSVPFSVKLGLGLK